jgi:hypothetical protein
MLTRRACLLALAFGLAAVAVAPAVRADLLPEPQRPSWNEHPAPQPDPPPERELERLALVAVALGVMALAGARAYRERWSRGDVSP